MLAGVVPKRRNASMATGRKNELLAQSMPIEAFFTIPVNDDGANFFRRGPFGDLFFSSPPILLAVFYY